MNKSKLVLGALLFITVASCSCSKSKTGATGATGTANVMYSTWASLNMTFNATDSAYEQTITADSITQAVLDSGLVLSYIKYTGASNQLQVENASNYMEEVYGLGTINLYSYTYNYSGIYFRYIIIPGGQSIGARSTAQAGSIQGYTKAQWKAMTYDQVTALLKLAK